MSLEEQFTWNPSLPSHRKMVAMVGNWSFTEHCQYWEMAGQLRGNYVTRDLPSWSGWCCLDGRDGFSFSGGCFRDHGSGSESRLSLCVSPKAPGSGTCQSLAPCAQNERFLPKPLSLRHTDTATENIKSIGSLCPDLSTLAFLGRLDSLLVQHIRFFP